jgi:ribonuclease R
MRGLKPPAPSGSVLSEAVDDRQNLEGLVVDVEITSWPTPTRPAVGRVIEVLGSPDDFGVDVEVMIRKHQLPRIFPEKVLAEARAVAHLDRSAVLTRRDFRELPIVTIDGETAKDFDDAVLVTERKEGGYELQVHIADVSEYVRERTSIWRRGSEEPASTSQIAPSPCCRRSFPAAFAACAPAKTGWC